MKIECIWEHNGGDSLLYAGNCMGAFTRGASLEEAVRKMPDEIRSYYAWLGEAAPGDIECDVVQEKDSQLEIKDADSDVIFKSEEATFTYSEYCELKELALKSAADFLRLYESIPDKNISALPLRKTFYGQIPRTAEEMYTHTKNVNSYYFGEIGVDADNEGNILECRRRGFELLEKMPGFPDNLMQEGSYGEMWSVRKVLRRFVWHDRIHAKAMWRMAKKTFDVEVENFLFLRGRKMNREIYASDGEYTLLKIAADDRDNYIELHRQLNGEQSLFLNPHCKDMMWKYVLEEEDNITYSIFDSYGEYCGSVELQHYKENIPEIGIELLEKKRNKGIAAKVVKLLAKRAYMDKKVDYFLIRISSKNEHSRHVFEKMGVIPIGSKESNFKKFINTYQENIKNIDNSADIQDIIEPYLNICNDLKEEVIYEYKLIPELFL